MSEILRWIGILIILLFPLYLWAYSLTLVENNAGTRTRFFVGLMSGIFSVGITFLLEKSFYDEWGTVGFLLGISVSFILLLLGGLLGSFLGSSFARKFLQKTSFFHILGIGGIFVILFALSRFFTGGFFLGGAIFVVFLSAFFEEISKHMSVLGVLGRYFRFSLRDLVVLSFCVALGFSFVENIFYIFMKNLGVGDVLLRVIFSFSAHLLSVLICTAFWWKALSYRFLGLKYFFWFFLGIFSATGTHFLYNWLLQISPIIMIIYFFLSYGLFVWLLQKE